MADPTHAVIGGGLAGLAAALELSGRGATVRLVEKADRLGGKVDETTVDGVVVPKAADNFLARRPEVRELAVQLGLEDQLYSPTARSPRIYRDGRLHLLPANVLGIPATDELSSSGLISPEGAARAAEDRTLPDDRPHADESVGAMVRRRLGDEVLEYLVDPLLGGINAGDSDQLSLRAGTPQLAELRDRRPSLLESARSTLDERPAPAGPVFQSIRGGLCRLVDAAEAELRSRSNAEIVLGQSPSIARRDDRWVVDGNEVEHLVLATPAFVSADLLRPFSATLSDRLAKIEYSSVAVAIVMLPPGTLDVDPSVSGVLVPRRCGLHVTAISFASHKWPDIGGDGRQILRISVGRREDTRWTEMTDDELVEVIRGDAAEVLGQHVPAGHWTIARWPKSLPQYDVGHLDWLAEVDSATSELPGLALVGAWRDGLGLPATVSSGRTAADVVPAR